MIRVIGGAVVMIIGATLAILAGINRWPGYLIYGCGGAVLILAGFGWQMSGFWKNRPSTWEYRLPPR